MLRLMVVCLLALLALAGCGKDEQRQVDPAADRASIESALQQWPTDFNAKNLDGVCSLFADDVVLSYPGGPDRDRREFCDRMHALFTEPDRQYSYARPEIREVLVDGDLATVRLMWTLTVKDGAGKVLDTMEEDGVDVFQRQSDGSWKIHISHAFTT